MDGMRGMACIDQSSAAIRLPVGQVGGQCDAACPFAVCPPKDRSKQQPRITRTLGARGTTKAEADASRKETMAARKRSFMLAVAWCGGSGSGTGGVGSWALWLKAIDLLCVGVVSVGPEVRV